jgi:hypothetical protein
MNFLIAESLEVPGVLGSKIMGHGYGGCIVTLVERPSARTLELHLKKRFQEEFRQDCAVVVCAVPATGTGDCLSVSKTSKASSRRYQPPPLPEEQSETLTRRLIPVAMGLGAIVGLFGAWLVTRTGEPTEE